MELTSGRLGPSLKIFLKSTPKEFFMFQEMKLSSSNIKKFQETETPRKIFIFQEKEFCFISGNGNSKKLLISQEVALRAQKKQPPLKKFLIVLEMELFYISEVTCKA